MDGWRPQDMETWLGNTNKRLDREERRTSKKGSWGNVTVSTRANEGEGIYVLGPDGTEHGPYPPAVGYFPLPGDEVVLNASGRGGYVAMGAKNDWVALPLKKTGVYFTYNANNAGERSWSVPGVGLRNGFAELSGLIALTSATPGTLLFVLPPGRRPDSTRVYVVSNSDIARTIQVEADGSVRIGSGWTVNGFVALDSIIFPVAGRATWTPIDPQGTVGSTHQFQNNWVDYVAGGGAYGRAAYWEDEYGVVWFRGLVKGGTVGDGLAIFTTPKNFYREQHVPAGSAEVMGTLHAGLVARPNTVNFKAPSGNVWISLSSATFFTQAALLNPAWERFTTDFVPGSGWTQYPTAATYTVPGKWTRPDGLVFLSGLMGGGALSPITPVANLADNAKRGQMRNRMFIAVSIAAYARVDVQGMGSNYSGTQSWGAINNTGGSATWFSWDGIKFIPGGA